MSGRCRFCGCTYYDACAYGCAWADRAQTLCTECEDIDKAWRQLKASQRAQLQWRRAFAAGFFDGYGDDNRGVHGMTARYKAGGRAARYFELGKAAGERVREAAA